jgi:hypothetical protein
MARAGGTAGGGMGGGPDSAPGGSSSKGPGTDGPGNAPGQGMDKFTVTHNIKDPSVSFNYQGRLGYGKGTIRDEGLNYNFNPSFAPNMTVFGQNFETPSFSYNVPTMDPRVGASLNLQGNQGNFNPSISANYSTGNTSVSGSVSPTGYGVQGYSNNLFGVPGLNFQGNYGDSGYRGMIGYSGDL